MPYKCTSKNRIDNNFLKYNQIIKILIDFKYNPTNKLSNIDFNNITNLKTIGNFQFVNDNKEQYFIYMIFEDKIAIKKYPLDSFLTNIIQKIEFYLKCTLLIEEKENSFYYYIRKNNVLIFKHISTNLFSGLIELYLRLSNRR